jgi:uncharacterized membrane protein YfcA
MPEARLDALLFGVGLVTGALNVVAGGGSFLTLPTLIFLGLPPTVANGTNRLGILTQNVVAVWGFHRHRVLAWRFALWASVPAVAGAALGTWAALEVGDETFKRLLAVFMVVISLWTLLDPGARQVGRLAPGTGDGGEGGDAGGAREGGGARLGLLAAGFFVVGLYGGFVQAGVGFLVLAATTFAGLDLVRGNAVKVLAVLAFTVVSLALFASQGAVDWPTGLVLAAGNALGGLWGVRLTVLKGHRWLRGVVTAAVLAFAVLLWFH